MSIATAARPIATWATLPSSAGTATIALIQWTTFIQAALVCVLPCATGRLKNGLTLGMMTTDAGWAIPASLLAQQPQQQHHQETTATADLHPQETMAGQHPQETTATADLHPQETMAGQHHQETTATADLHHRQTMA